MQPVCETPSCMIDYSKKNNLSKKIAKQEIKEMKDRGMSHSDYENLLQPIINKITATIDMGYNCISCNAQISQINRANAGHRFAVGGNNSLRFNLLNIWQQGVCCNKHKSGNPDGYDAALKEMGIYNTVHELKSIYPLVKLTSFEMKEKIDIARQILKRITKENKLYSLQERIELRHLLNLEIGIYTKHHQEHHPE